MTRVFRHERTNRPDKQFLLSPCKLPYINFADTPNIPESTAGTISNEAFFNLGMEKNASKHLHYTVTRHVDYSLDTKQRAQG